MSNNSGTSLPGRKPQGMGQRQYGEVLKEWEGGGVMETMINKKL